jgi:hypothetical protein
MPWLTISLSDRCETKEEGRPVSASLEAGFYFLLTLMAVKLSSEGCSQTC